MANFEDVAEKSGWGLLHKFLVGLASTCSFAQAIGQLSIPFAIPITACDAQMSEAKILNVNLCFSLGMAIGGLVLSGTSDVIGRKSMIPATLILIFGSNFASGFSQGYVMILLCAFILGSGVSSNAVCVKIHLAEILPISKRTQCLLILDMCWTCGYILFSFLCWMITPLIINNYNMEMRMVTWRLIYGLSGALSIMTACATALLVPSPRYLLLNKRRNEANNVLKHMYAINNSKHCESFELSEENLQGLINDYGMSNENFPSNCTEQVFYVLQKINVASKIIFNSRFKWLTIVLVLLRITTFYGIFMVNVWLAKSLYYGENDECFLKGTTILHLEERTDDETKCNFKPSYNFYRDFLYVAFSILLGQLVLMLIINKCGRRVTILIGCAICGLSNVVLYMKNSYGIRLLVSSIFMLFYSLVLSTLDIVTIESYPTAIRGTAAGETQFFAYIISGLFKKHFRTPCDISFIFVGGTMLGATLLAFFIPNYKHRPMEE